MENELIEKYKQELMRMYRASAGAKASAVNEFSDALQRSAQNINSFQSSVEGQAENPEFQNRNNPQSQIQNRNISESQIQNRMQIPVTQSDSESMGFSSPEEMRRFMGEEDQRTDNQMIQNERQMLTRESQGQSFLEREAESSDFTRQAGNNTQNSTMQNSIVQNRNIQNADPTATAVPSSDNRGQTQIRQSTPPIPKRPDDGEDIGKLIANVTTVRDLYPVPNAKVTVFTGPYETMDVVGTRTTNESGRTTPFELYAPPTSNSLRPNSPGPEYAEYNMLVQADGFVDNIHLKIPIFKGITSVQPSRLVLNETAGPNPGPYYYDSSSSYDL